MHGQQLHRGHTQLGQVFQNRLAAHPQKTAALFAAQPFEFGSHAFDMGLVNQRLRGTDFGRRVLAPFKTRVHHDRPRHIGGTVTAIKTKVGGLGPDRIAHHGVVPRHFANNALGIWIHQQFVGIETMPVFRLVRAVYTVAITGPRRQAGDIYVPNIAVPFQQRNAGDFDPAVSVKHT
jgi:hypothetical protein